MIHVARGRAFHVGEVRSDYPARDESEGCETTVSGRLSAETIQRIVRRNFGRIRFCYEDGLRTNPALEVARDGSVSTAQDGGSDLASESVRQCVVRAFGDMSFPEHEGGIVTVVPARAFSGSVSGLPSPP